MRFRRQSWPWVSAGALPVLMSAPTANGATAVNVNTAANCSITGANAAQFAGSVGRGDRRGRSKRGSCWCSSGRWAPGARTASLELPADINPSDDGLTGHRTAGGIGYAGEEPKPNCYDLDGNGTAAATVDGLLIVRQMPGITGAAIGRASPSHRATVEKGACVCENAVRLA